MKKILDFEKIDILAEKIALYLKGNETIAIIGDLGTGKTTITKKVANSIGVKEIVKSPTFNIVHEYYSGKYNLFHFDVYRLSGDDELYDIGYDDYMAREGIKIIEWADLIEKSLPGEYIEIKLYHKGDREREVSLSYVGNLEKEGEILKYVDFGD